MFSRIQTEEPSRSSKGWIIVVIIFACLVILLTGVYRREVGDIQQSADLKIDSGDTAWMLSSSALVMLMTLPGLALYYGSYAEYKNQVNTMFMIFIAYAVTTVVWTFWAYALAFGEDRGGYIGSGRHIFLQNISPSSINTLAPTIPEYTFCMYQLTFAAITIALGAGGCIDRLKIKTWIAFIVLWITIVYAPIAHWVWGGGFLSAWGVLDFAGGTVVHISSGVTALVTSLIIGKPRNREKPVKNLTFVVIGTGMIWFGWFGFDGGSALASNGSAAIAFLNTNFSAAVGALCWALLQAYHTGKPTLGGMCDGAIAGLVCITPAAGYVNTIGAFILGILAMGAYGVTLIKERTRIFYDPANAFCVHFVGGAIGAIFLGLYADPGIGGKAGFMFGNYIQLGWQFAGVGIVTAYTAVLTAAIMLLLKYTIGLQVKESDQIYGLDRTQHGEVPYIAQESMTSMPEIEKNAFNGFDELNNPPTLMAVKSYNDEDPEFKSNI